MLQVSVLEVSVLEVSVLEVSVLEEEEGGGGRGGGADTALKTKTPHDNVGNKRYNMSECQLVGSQDIHPGFVSTMPALTQCPICSLHGDLAAMSLGLGARSANSWTNSSGPAGLTQLAAVNRWVLLGKMTGKSHRNHGKIYGVRLRFSLKSTQ